MSKIKNTYMKILCVLLSVIVLFFAVNNSYFSSEKIDIVQATGIEIVGVYITVEMVIKLVCAIGATCLGAGLIKELADMDFNAVINNVHDWLRDHLDILDSAEIDGTSALKTWALADSWSIVDGGGNGPNPSPNPSGKFDKINLPDPFTLINLAGMGSILAEQIYNKFVVQDQIYNDIAHSYVSDKIGNINKPDNLDPVLSAFNKIYGEHDKPLLSGYNGNPAMQSDGKYHYSIINGKNVATIISDRLNIGGWIENRPYYGSGYSLDMLYVVWEDYVQFYTPDGKEVYRDKQDKACYKSKSIDGTWTEHPISCSFPIFNSQSDYNLWKNGDTSIQPINKNYIDSNDEYGWASTASITPNDLLQATNSIRDSLNDKQVSLKSLQTAINALKAQLEDKNPNTNPALPSITFPTVNDYKDTYKNVIDDPVIFPNDNYEPVPSSKPDIGETGKDYSGLLGTIINLLRSILQVIKEIAEFLKNWFIINPALIQADLLESIKNIPSIHEFDPILGYIEEFKLAITNSYEYPVLKIKTPDILKTFYKNTDIILLDFKDYATYFIWVRTILAFSICFGFLLWIVKDIKIAFTLN